LVLLKLENDSHRSKEWSNLIVLIASHEMSGPAGDKLKSSDAVNVYMHASSKVDDDKIVLMLN
jgi:hypothetical protein